MLPSDRLEGLIPAETAEICLLDGVARQGLPTSPALANLSGLEMDRLIQDGLHQAGIDSAYTRYADDLTVSFDDASQKHAVSQFVRDAVKSSGFILNPAKTHFQRLKNGRVIITGVAVDKNGVHPTRRTRRNMCAAMHQQNFESYAGLKEWCRCKTPGKYSKSQALRLFDLAKKWRIPLRKKHALLISEKKTERYGDLVVSGDPFVMLGLGRFVKNPKSKYPREYVWPDAFHWYKKSNTFYLLLEGARVAYLDTGDTMTIDGITAPVVDEWLPVFEFESGTLVYPRVSSPNEEQKRLMGALDKSGIINSAKFSPTAPPFTTFVRGKVPHGYQNYLRHYDLLASSERRDGKLIWRVCSK